MQSLIGEEVGLSDWVVIDQHRIDQFAEATTDHQWIHVDTERAAREMPDGKTIAHGYLTIALIPVLTRNFIHVENLARTVNFGLNKVRFIAPIPVGSRLRGRSIVLQAQQRADALLGQDSGAGDHAAVGTGERLVEGQDGVVGDVALQAGRVAFERPGGDSRTAAVGVGRGRQQVAVAIFHQAAAAADHAVEG